MTFTRSLLIRPHRALVETWGGRERSSALPFVPSEIACAAVDEVTGVSRFPVMQIDSSSVTHFNCTLVLGDKSTWILCPFFFSVLLGLV